MHDQCVLCPCLSHHRASSASQSGAQSVVLHLNDWRPPPGPAGAEFDGRTQGCSGVLKLTLAVLALLPDNDELCESFSPYPWLVARCTLRLLEAMLLSRHSLQEALVADFARFNGVPIVVKKLATRKSPSKVCRSWPAPCFGSSAPLTLLLGATL